MGPNLPKRCKFSNGKFLRNSQEILENFPGISDDPNNMFGKNVIISQKILKKFLGIFQEILTFFHTEKLQNYSMRISREILEKFSRNSRESLMTQNKKHFSYHHALVRSFIIPSRKKKLQSLNSAKRGLLNMNPQHHLRYNYKTRLGITGQN